MGNSDTDVFRCEGRVTTHFVFRESAVIVILFPLLSSLKKDACPMVNPGLLFCSPEINISANIILSVFVKVPVTLTKLSVENKNHLAKQNIYVLFYVSKIYVSKTCMHAFQIFFCFLRKNLF